jgi:hypothetical protein
MNVRAVFCLSLGLWISPLAAQQAQVIASRGETFAFPTADPRAAAASPSPAVSASVAAETDLSGDSFGLPAGQSIYKATLTESPAAVCTQASAPVLAAPKIYAFDHLQFSSAAIKGAFSHDNLVKMARNFVPGQPLPDAPPYVPLSKQQKFDLFVHRSYSFDTVSGAIMDSLTAQATGAYPSFGGGMAGYGKRLGAATAGAESASFFSTFALPTLLHQDPRYFRATQTEVSQRLAYAASRVLIGRSDDGRNVVNTSLILSQFIQAAVSNAYIPYRRETVPGTMENAVAGLGSVAQARILNEFWPDIMSFVSHHEPRFVHSWQDRWDNSNLGHKWENSSLGQWSQK